MKAHLICKKCKAINRLDMDRASEAICARCKQALSIKNPVTDVSLSELTRLVSSSPLSLVVDFWAPWCGPCQSFAPIFAEGAKQQIGKYLFVKINTEEEREVGMRYGIRGIPTLIVFANGTEAARKSGALDSRSLTSWLDGLSVSNR